MSSPQGKAEKPITEFEQWVLNEHWGAVLSSVNDPSGLRVGTYKDGLWIEIKDDHLRDLGRKYGVKPVVILGG